VDRITEMLDQLSELDDAQVDELQNAIISEFETVETEEPSSQTVDAMTSLADMLDTVRGELKQREAAAQELAQRAADAAARVKGEDAKEDMPSELSEEVKDESAPEAEAAMAEVKEEEESAPAPVEAEPTEAPVETETEEAPASEEKDDEEKKKMSEASTVAEETAELSTEEVTEAPVEVAEETVTASAEEAADESVEAEAPAEESEATVEEAAEEAAAEEDAVSEEAAEEDAAIEDAEEASVEVPAEAELASEEVAIEETSDTTELSTEEVQETMEAPVTAAANADNFELEVPADRRMETKESVAPVAITAGADIPGYTAGSSLDSMDAVAEAMAKRLHGLRRVNGGDGEQHIVASLTTSYPEERTLSTDAEENWSKIHAVTSPEAIVAAGGHVAPFEARYDIFGMGTTARPVRDSLPRFQADRGGIRFVTPPALVDHADAVGIWTAANDAAETPSPASKQSLTVSAAAENTVATDAITLQMQFGNLATRAYPELIARHNELGLIQHAREAEAQTLTAIGAASTAVTSTSLIGMGRDVLVQVGRAAAAYRSRHRLEADAPLRVIMPAWVKDAMVADLALAMPGDNTLAAGAEIDGYLASRGINVTFTLDGDVFAAQSSGAMTEFKDTFVWYIFAEGTFLFLDGGTLDLGIIRDSTLVGTNDYKMFVETFEGVAKVGVESIKVTSTVQVNGAAAALRDTLGGVASAAIEY
jgi:chemotaxis protein histidine kinase CheA